MSVFTWGQDSIQVKNDSDSVWIGSITLIEMLGFGI